MRLPLIPPSQASLPNRQRPLYDDMKRGIETSFKGFKAMADDGTLIGPWNPWLHFPKFGGPGWELVKALAIFAEAVRRTVREVAILVTGHAFPFRLRTLRAYSRRGTARLARRDDRNDLRGPAAGRSRARGRDRLRYRVCARVGAAAAATQLRPGEGDVRRRRPCRTHQPRWPVLLRVDHTERVRRTRAGLTRPRGISPRHA